MEEALTFDDICLIPKYSDVRHRKYVDTKIKLGNYYYNTPLIASNMATVIGPRMAQEIVKSGGLALLHRFDTLDHQELNYHNSSPYGTKAPANIGLSLGVNKDAYDSFWHFFQLTGCNIFVVDCAHADHELAINMIKFLKSMKGDIGFEPMVIAGNVVTGDGACRLFEAGADVVKCGIGSGSICTSRIMAGHGVPQLHALMDIQKDRLRFFPERQVISDGGVRTPGDAVKALCFSDAVMMGGVFAACEEAPGDIKIINGIKYKKHEGSSTYRSSNVEGVKGWVKIKGTYLSVLEYFLDGIRSGCSYAGVNNVRELQNDPKFVRLTSAGLKESHPHDILLDSDG